LRRQPLDRAFFARDALRVARSLLGKILVRETKDGVVAGRLVEVEAYRGPHDLAAHTAGGRRTPRNEVMWGPPGYAYVYFVYGMHWCMNAVAAKEGAPEAVLLRAVEPLEGADLMQARRAEGRAKGRPIPVARLASGPANLCKAFAVDRSLNAADLCDPRSPLRLLDAPPVPLAKIRATPRIGVDYAGDHAELPWRFCLAGSPSVSADG
jgi:DNA-3-methyladenine glycosylase